MLLDAFGAHIPSFVSPIVTVFIIVWFFLKSKRELAKTAPTKQMAVKK